MEKLTIGSKIPSITSRDQNGKVKELEAGREFLIKLGD